MRKCLLAVQGPLQFMAGLIAMEWYGQVMHESSDSEVVLLMYDFLVPLEVEKHLEEAIRSLTGIRQWKKIIFISAMEMSRIMRRKYSESVHQLRSILGEPSFDEIFLMRDYAGAGSPLILNAYPDAAKITYGDSFGLVGNESELCFHWSWSLKSVNIYLMAFVRKVLFGGPKRFDFDTAVLTIPVDWSGSYLNDIPLLVPNREFALARLKECCAQLPRLSAYCNNLLEGAHNPCLFILSTLFQSGLMSIENEIALYISIIRQTAPRGSTIILKPHPRSNMTILATVVNAVEAEYRVKVIDYSQFSRIPIELWISMITECTIVAIYSTCCVNLSYLYGKEVILPLNESNIKQYVYPEWIESVTKGNTMNLESMNRLKEWDRKSVLWKATKRNL